MDKFGSRTFWVFLELCRLKIVFFNAAVVRPPQDNCASALAARQFLQLGAASVEPGVYLTIPLSLEGMSIFFLHFFTKADFRLFHLLFWPAFGHGTLDQPLVTGVFLVTEILVMNFAKMNSSLIFKNRKDCET